MDSRAAVFTREPQAVEVYQAGTWWAGELLGWRHDQDGGCEVWVRVVLDGVEETAWTQLTSLRLPQPPHATTNDRRGRHAPDSQEMSVARHPAGRRARSAGAAPVSTSGHVESRELSVVPAQPYAGGRRTADETAQFASVGRRRAPDTLTFPAVGRRRAPETGESVRGGRRRAPEGTPAAASAAGAAGRHRAPVDPGRHRIADTGLSSVVARVPDEAVPVPAAGAPATIRVPRPARSGNAGGRAVPAWNVPAGLESELLTRPMRLSDHIPHARRPATDESIPTL